MLSGDFVEMDVLRQQAQMAVVVGRCPCGCATIELAVDEDVPRLLGLEGYGPIVDAWIPDRSDAHTAFDLILFAEDGRLRSVEIVYYGDMVPTVFPHPREFDTPVVRKAAFEQ